MNPPSYFPSRDDADVMSIHSNAPSYTSTLPPQYDAASTSDPTSDPTPARARQQHYSSLLSNVPLSEHYGVASWTSLTGSEHQNRAYANVAARRARRDEARREMDVARVALDRLQVVEKVEVEMVQEEAHSLVQEGKSWDHLLVQMADWNERERSWNEYKKRYEADAKKKKLGRRIFGKLS